MIDGIIKYNIEHQSKKAPEFLGYGELEALRSRLFALGLIGEKDGIGYGNLSMRTGEPKTFFITATQTGKESALSLQQYTYISTYDFNAFKVISHGAYQPSSEALSHAMIYEVSSEITAVIHIHSAALWNFMKNNNFLATTAEYGTVAMVKEIAALYKARDPFAHNTFVMRGHEDGIITFGKSVKEAELTLYKIIQDYLLQEKK